MPDKVKMVEVKSEITAHLSELGYTVTLEDATTMVAAMGNHNKMTWKLKCTGVKGFEVMLYCPDKECFTKECHFNDDGNNWFTFARFRRDAEGVKNFITWLSEILTSHKHLKEALQDNALPEPLKFSGRMYEEIGGYIIGGLVWRVKVLGIRSITKTGPDSYSVTDASVPNQPAWFHVELHTSSGNAEILTDGDNWYVVITTKSNHRKIIMSHGIADLLKMMNNRDQELIKHAIGLYVTELERAG
jgi:hypothetical protein